MSVKFAPSLLCMDFLHVEEQIQVLNRRADWLHVDLMDLHFVKNMGLCPAFVKAIRPVAEKPIDCHIMGWDSSWWLQTLAEAGADMLTVHRETLGEDGAAVFQQIRALGCAAGLAISPETSAEEAAPYLPLVDKVTVMTVKPGFPGAPFLWDMLPKIERLAQLRRERGLSFEIEMDGSCADDNFQALRRAGTNVFVVGAAALFGRDSCLERAFDLMEQSFLGGVRGR